MKLSIEDRREIDGLISGKLAPDRLWCAFTWEKTEEGRQYWLDASNQAELTADNIAKLRQLRDDAQVANA